MKVVEKIKIILIFLIFNIAFSSSLFSNNEITLSWSIKNDFFYHPGQFDILATASKQFTIDWGDGNVDTITATGNLQHFIHEYTPTNYSVKITGLTEDCLIIEFRVPVTYPFIYLYALNISNCPALKYLDCSGSILTKLDISNCPDLEYLDCSNNSLTELDISANTALKYLDCSNNDSRVYNQGGTGISYLDFTNCELTYLDCSYNSFLLSNLYAASTMIGEIENKLFENQTLLKKRLMIRTPVDFSTEIEFGGVATVFDVKRRYGTDTAILGVDYTINEGIITFLTRGISNESFIVTMTNEAIPNALVSASFEVYDFMNLLSELTISDGILEPEFNSIDFDYVVNLDEDISEITIDAIPNNPNTILTGTGKISLSFGENNFIVNALTWVSEYEGVSHDYKIKIIRGDVSITDIFSLSKIKLYPNPANDIVVIDFGEDFIHYQSLCIYDLMGKTCIKIAVAQEKQQIDIHNLPIGSYIVQVIGKDKPFMSEKLLIIR